MEGISVILGNNLAGGRVWREVPPPPIVTDFPSLPAQADVDRQFSEVFVTCAVTRAMNKNTSEKQDLEFKSDCEKKNNSWFFVSFSFCFSAGFGGGATGGCHLEGNVFCRIVR